jgi:hypothetical protein
MILLRHDMYTKERIDERVTLLTKCHLEIDGRKSDCLVENISTVGALLQVDETDYKYISVGDKGTIAVLLLSPVHYICSVIRKEHGKIGLQFQ